MASDAIIPDFGDYIDYVNSAAAGANLLSYNLFVNQVSTADSVAASAGSVDVDYSDYADYVTSTDADI